MKRETRTSQTPGTIGAEVRTLLERALTDLAFAPATQGFLDRMQRLAELLALWGARTNLTARPGDSAETTFHILDSLMLLVLAGHPEGASIRQALGEGRRVLDLGSGAGFPGLVLAAACGAHFTLCESRHKRASFLSVAIAEMGLDNAIVKSGRAEAMNAAGGYDALMARAVGGWPSLWRIAAGALRHGGFAILYLARDQRVDSKLARSLGFGDAQRLQYVIERDSKPVNRSLLIFQKE